MSEQEHTVEGSSTDTSAAASAAPEQACEVVDAAANIVAVVKRWPAFEDFGAGLQEAYHQAHGVAFNLNTVRGNQEARQLRQRLVRTRTAIKDRQKDEKAKLRKKIEEDLTLVDDVATKALEFVAALEDPLDEAIRADEQRRKDEAAIKKRLELERIAALVQRINDITSVAARAVDLNSVEIERKIALIEKLEIDASFEEKLEEAILAKKNTLARLNELHARAVKLEAERADAAANAARVQQLEQEAAERRRQEEAQRQERERQEAEQREQRAAEERAAREAEQARQARLAAAQAAVGEIQRLARSAVKLGTAAILELIEKVRGLQATIDCGEHAQLIEAERSATIDYLTELHADKYEAEVRQAEIDRANREAEEARRAQEMLLAEIEGFRQDLFASQLEDKTPERARRRLDELKRVTIDPQRWGVLAGSAQAVLDATITGLEQWVHQLENPPTPIERVQAEERPADAPAEQAAEAPVTFGVDLSQVADQTATGVIEFIEPSTTESGEADGGYAPLTAEEAYEEEAEGLRIKQIENDLLEHQALHALLGEVVNVAKQAKRMTAGGPYVVPAADFQQMCEALTRVPLPGGQRYAADGTLLNADGNRSIFCDVDC